MKMAYYKIGIMQTDVNTTTPVTPPTVNKKINPKAKRIGAFSSMELPHKVASQLNIFIPVGMAITIVAAVK
jgi:hypothetical protein